MWLPEKRGVKVKLSLAGRVLQRYLWCRTSKAYRFYIFRLSHLYRWKREQHRGAKWELIAAKVYVFDT